MDTGYIFGKLRKFYISYYSQFLLATLSFVYNKGFSSRCRHGFSSDATPSSEQVGEISIFKVVLRVTQSYPESFRVTQELPRVTRSRPKVNYMNENKLGDGQTDGHSHLKRCEDASKN